MRPSFVSSLTFFIQCIHGATSPQVDYPKFRTEPTFKQIPFSLNYISDDLTLLQPGYLFIAPYHMRPAPLITFGPQIIDVQGNLVWHGLQMVNNVSPHFAPCRYLGQVEDHLCFFDATDPKSAYSIGKVRILDNSYTEIGPDYGGHGGLRDPDHHEMQTPRFSHGQTLLTTVYEVRTRDLTPYNGAKEGYVLDGCFQEVDLRNHSVVFEWCSLDHVDIWATEVFIHQSSNYTTPIAGDGSLQAPWDFLHINAIDKTDEGDFLVSARHFDAVLKIAGNNSTYAPGSIIWTLGGNHSDFELGEARFSRQHMVRFIESNQSVTTLSLFDNAFDGFVAQAEYSSGKIISVNTQEMKAELLQELRLPDHEGIHADSQGGLEILPNGNRLVGWGFLPDITEYDVEGNLLYHANFTPGIHIENFRAYKSSWIGMPKTKPKLVAYTRSCDESHPLFMYVSWNGATQVDHYRFYTSSISMLGPWTQVAEVKKQVFEDMAHTSTGFKPYAFVRAYDTSGVSLASSDIVRVFVPKLNLTENCDGMGCNEPDSFDYDDQFSRWEECTSFSSRPETAGAVLGSTLVLFFIGVACVWCSWIRKQGSVVELPLVKTQGYTAVPQHSVV